MKKLIFALLIILSSTIAFSQEKGLFLTVGGSFGRTNFRYELEEGKPKPGLGYGVGLGAQYFFTKHLGLSLGVDLSVFNTKSYFPDKGFEFKGVFDEEEDYNDLRIRLINWTEKQKTYFIDIPLMLRFQHKWGKKEMHGFYFAFGPKLQIPVKSSYRIEDRKNENDVRVEAYYPEHGLYVAYEGSGVQVPQHGYGTTNKLWEGKNSLKPGVGIVGELGFLIGLSRRIDLTVGVSAEYGFTNIKKNAIELMEIVEGKTAQDGKVADIVGYNGILNSNKTGPIHPTSIKANIGLRIKIGKLSKKEDEEEKLDEILDKLKNRDTIIINPVVVPVYLPNPNANNAPAEDDPDGTPARRKGAAAVPQVVIDELQEPIYFDLDKYNLDQEAITILDRKVALMKKHPEASVSVVAHTCDLGTTGHNDELSLNRAMAARYYMISKGISPSRIELIPMGKHYPMHPNTSEDSRRLNRRDDFIFNR